MIFPKQDMTYVKSKEYSFLGFLILISVEPSIDCKISELRPYHLTFLFKDKVLFSFSFGKIGV